MFPALYSEYIPIGWVSFTDVVGFTKMSSLSDSKTIISLLNEMFSLMDVEATNFGIEKIKTIGDAFMSGKMPHGANGERTDLDGMAMIQFLLRIIALTKSVKKPKSARSENDTHLSIRVGLNVGPMSAGIVGFERPLYDLFGDTVNTAARLEGSGVPNTIHILQSVLPHLGKYVNGLMYSEKREHLDAMVEDNEEPRRSVHLKGIGQVTTKLVVGCTLVTRSRSMSRHPVGESDGGGRVLSAGGDDDFHQDESFEFAPSGPSATAVDLRGPFVPLSQRPKNPEDQKRSSTDFNQTVVLEVE